MLREEAHDFLRFIPIIFGFTSLALAIIRVLSFRHTLRGWKMPMLMRVLIRDQAIYFIVCVISIRWRCRSCNKIIRLSRLCFYVAVQLSLNAPLPIYTISILSPMASPAVLCVIGARLMMNLKEAGRREAIHIGGETLSSLHFTNPSPGHESSRESDFM